ncbi:MAG TPA: amidase family protein [Blastocatellia bacterium]|nr:amidase family protein [Blastocatellia bacterium]
MNNLVFATVQELATGIRQRHVSATEVLEGYLAQIARHNPALNAIVTLDEERARRRAQDADAALARGEVWGPLHGIPITIKDSIETAGLRTTSGFPPLTDYVPSTDAPVVARLRAAGAIILGKTNLPTMAGDGQTDNPIFGRSNNPWDLTRTPGGSTGGGGAAVAAGLSPLELGSDIGGSVRIPAHYCGVFTIKPTDHRVPTTGHIPEPPGAPRGVRHMGQIGPLARSVEDLILTLNLIAGPDGSQWEIPPVPLEAAPDRALRACRLAWTDDFGGVPVTTDTKRALARVAAELERLGTIINYCPPTAFDFPTAWENFGEMFLAEVGSTMSPEEEAELAAHFGAALDSEVPLVRGLARGVGATMRQYTAMLMKRDGLIAILEQFFAARDALLCPVTVGPAIRHCPTGTPVAVDGHVIPYWPALLAYTSPFNLTGHPAAVVPLGHSAEGLPIGLQIVGRRWSDMHLLAIAARIALVLGPCQHPPGY